MQRDKSAEQLNDEILAAMAAIAQDPCVGYRMRGLPVLEALCAYHLPKPLRRWRVIYRFRPGHQAPELILLGEHWKAIGGSGSGGSPSGIGARLQFQDVYDAVATFHGGDSKQERKAISKALRAHEKERCCRRSEA